MNTKIPLTKEAIVNHFIDGEIKERRYWEKGVTYTIKRKAIEFPITADDDIEVLLKIRQMEGTFGY